MQIKNTLEVTRRERTGTRYAKRERAVGKLPAVLYGHGANPVSLSLDAKEAIRCFESGERVFNISLKEENIEQTVLLKDLQFDYLGTNIVHVDLTRVDLSEEIEAAVSLRFVGESPGSKHGGAIVTHPMSTITIQCTVADLPESIEVDISGVQENDSLHAGQVELPAGLTLAGDPDDILYAVHIQVETDEDAEGEGEAVGAESAEPEVITEKKAEDEDKKEG